MMHPNKVVHFEIPVNDVASGSEFYGTVFAWHLQPWPMPDGSSYMAARTVPVDEITHAPKQPGAVNGGIINRTANVKAPILTIRVESIDHSLRKIIDGGGSIVEPKTELAGMGFQAYFSDPDGNVLGLWEDLKAAAQARAKEPEPDRQAQSQAPAELLAF